jgi:glutaredoxin
MTSRFLVYYKSGCPYSEGAIEYLQQRQIPMEKYEITYQPNIRSKLIGETGQRTVPYIFYVDTSQKVTFIGGFSELKKLQWNNGILI